MPDKDAGRFDVSLILPEDINQLPTAPDAGRVVETAPVKEPETPLEWVKLNLFSGPFNSILSVVTSVILIVTLWKLFDFLFIDGDWHVIRANMKGYMAGPFPIEEAWRLWTCLYLVAALAGLSFGASRWRARPSLRRYVTAGLVTAAGVLILGFVVQSGLARALTAGVPAVTVLFIFAGRSAARFVRRFWIWAWLVLFPLLMVIVRGFDGVPPRLWGGFFFNLTAAVVAIFASFPFGVALALGRRSSLPVIRLFCVGVIEIFRGVPLVAWLIASKYVVDLLLPPQLELPDIVKALVAMTMFSAAYIAEIVRGGLQGVPEGQYEAARALGLSTSRMMALIVLPQALRSTIPALISHFISLFKDTALFAAIEVTDLLAAATRLGLEFQLKEAQTLLFAALLFWIVAFSMSRWSQRLELRLGVGER